MNTQADIDQRLLRLFPVKILKEHFQIEGTQATMLEAVKAQNNSASVQSFVNQNFGYLKQHVYIIKLGRPCVRSHFNTAAHPFPLGIAFQAVENGRSYTSLPSVRYNGFYQVGSTYNSFQVDFWQPTRLEFRDDYTVVFYAGIIEKNIAAYLEGINKAFGVGKSNNDDFLSVIMKYFEPFEPTMCDFNRGIKELTDNDVLDFSSVKYKDHYSITHEVMDGVRTFKKEYLDKYTHLTSKPIQKSTFRYLKGDRELAQHFSADPCKGVISVPIFPEHLNQVSNVVTEILRSN